MRHASLSLYRALLRAVKDFPVRPVARKLHNNIREVFEVHKEENCATKIERLHGDGEAALRVIAFLRHLPKDDDPTDLVAAQEDFDMVFRQHFKDKQTRE